MLIPLKLYRDKPLQRQLYEQLLQLIMSSQLAAGTRMPSTRMLADQLSISRITAMLTYERLIAEGYLRTIPAKGTFVYRIATDSTSSTTQDTADSPETEAECLVGRPDCGLFPDAKWRGLVRSALDQMDAGAAHRHADGHPALRKAIARWLSTSRGLAVDADQIILAHGRQHALHIAAHLLLRPGDRAVVESPGDPAAETLLAGTGATLVAVPVDDDGIQTERLPAGPIAMALVTPEHQRPLGAVMGLPRRHALLAWAAMSGAIVVEEDSDSELRYGAMDAPPLMGLERTEMVIHVGDFAASLGPGVTLGHLAVPCRLIEPARAASRLVGEYAGRLEADALAALLDSGLYSRHLHQIRKIYLNRCDTMIRSLRQHFGEHTPIGGMSAGLHLAWMPHNGSAGMMAALARRFGLDAGQAGDRVVLMGFGRLDACQIEAGIGRLHAALAGAEEGLALLQD
jgi:GntR family transcriptional regulator / MocR family aminotransferase